MAIWEVASKMCWLAASIETPGVILDTYHNYVQLYVESLARVPAHVEPGIKFLQL